MVVRVSCQGQPTTMKLFEFTLVLLTLRPKRSICAVVQTLNSLCGPSFHQIPDIDTECPRKNAVGYWYIFIGTPCITNTILSPKMLPICRAVLFGHHFIWNNILYCEVYMLFTFYIMCLFKRCYSLLQKYLERRI